MLLNVWTTKWDGHVIEVRNRCFSAELVIDGECVDQAPGMFRHDLRGTITRPIPGNTKGLCRNDDCKHQNEPVALFCANCGQKLPDHVASHDVRASVEFRFPPSVGCRVFVDGVRVFC
jgi:hypothetical protein